jgi:DNA-binding Xre family transcriptional regulator
MITRLSFLYNFREKQLKKIDFIRYFLHLTDLPQITMANLFILKTGKAKAIRFSTLESICKYLQCQPGDILKHTHETPEE